MVRKPVLNTFIKNVAKLAAGHEHYLALTKTQDLYVCVTGSQQDFEYKRMQKIRHFS